MHTISNLIDLINLFSFVDRDMFMRYAGEGIGHSTTISVTSNTAKESSEDSVEGIDIDEGSNLGFSDSGADDLFGGDEDDTIGDESEISDLEDGEDEDEDADESDDEDGDDDNGDDDDEDDEDDDDGLEGYYGSL